MLPLGGAHPAGALGKRFFSGSSGSLKAVDLKPKNGRGGHQTSEFLGSALSDDG